MMYTPTPTPTPPASPTLTAPRRRWVATIAAIAVLAAACSSDDDIASSGRTTDDRSPEATAATTESVVAATDADRPETRRPALELVDCGNGVECALVEVPLDHDDPDGTSTTIGVTLHPASGDRIGALFVNPGGPGVPAAEGVRELVESAPPELVERFDIVGVDPRGTGRSGPVDCDGSGDTFGAGAPGGSTRDVQAFLADFTARAEACAREPGAEVLASLTTEHAARDMDAVRAALGEKQLNFIGYSYGTAIGQVYATLFPDRVRTMVLDAPVPLDPDESPHEMLSDLTEQALERLDASCAAFPECLPDGPSLLGAITRVRDRISAGENADELDHDRLDRAVRSVVGAPMRMGELSEALRSALDGDLRPLGEMAGDPAAERRLATAAIVCADGWNVAAGTAAEATEQAEATADRVLGPRWETPCDRWPVAGTGLAPVEYAGASPIVIVAGSHDPITPLDWAEEIAASLGSSARLVTVGTSQHGTTFGTSACVDEQVVAYLLDEVVPTRSCDLEGIFYMGVDPQGLVEGFMPEGPAAIAGLEPGDRIVTIDGAAFEAGAPFPSGPVGERLTLGVERAGDELTVDIVRWPPQPWEMWQLGE